jgi:multicomponent Na+:H+ antiporter subunit D
VSLLPLVVAAIGGGVLAWAARDAGRAGTAIGFAALLVVAVLAAVMHDPATGGTLAGEAVALDGYARLFLVIASVTGVLLTVLGTVLPDGRSRPPASATTDAEPLGRPAPSFLLFLAAAALALGVVAPSAALVPAAAGGIAGFVAVGRLAAGSRRRGGRMDDALEEAEAAVLRRRLGIELLRIALALAAAVVALELLVGLADVIAGEPFGVGAAALALAGAAGLRIGIVPFQGHAARLAQSANRAALPILALWGPALFALAALAGFEAAVIPLDLPLVLERGVIAGFAVLTILAGGVGALVQDDIDHIVTYSILGDAGFVMLAFATPDPAVWGPARAWLLLLPVAKSGLLAWSLATGRTFGTRSLLELRGWARRAPLLGLALVLLTLATVGVPGLASYDARLALLRGAFGEPIRSLVFIASLISVLVMVRVLILGLDRPLALVQGAADERLRRPGPDLRRRVGATARATVDLNRAPLSAAVVVAMALVAATLGAGFLGFRATASADPPAALPRPEPTLPGPTFQPVPTETPAAPSGPAASRSPKSS